MTDQEKDKKLNPYSAHPWIEKGTGWYKGSEYLIGYKIYYNDKPFYNCKGRNSDYTESLVSYLNLAFVQGMKVMGEIQKEKLKKQVEQEQK